MNLAKAQLRVPGREVFDGVLVGFVSTWGLRMPTNSIFREFVGGCFFFLRVFFFGDRFFFCYKKWGEETSKKLRGGAVSCSAKICQIWVTRILKLTTDD